MKLGIFTDSHYASPQMNTPERNKSGSLQKIKDAYSLFTAEKCDLVISLGDLIDKDVSREQIAENLRQVANVINSYSVPTVCVMGNHDAFELSVDEFYSILGGHEPKNIQSNGKTLIFIDACYFKSGIHYQPGDSEWTNTFYPHTDDLNAQLSQASGDAYVFMHQNIDPNIDKSHRIANDAEIREMLEKHPHVKTAFQGHYHPGMKSVHNGINYTTFPAMCTHDDAYFIVEI